MLDHIYHRLQKNHLNNPRSPPYPAPSTSITLLPSVPTKIWYPAGEASAKPSLNPVFSGYRPLRRLKRQTPKVAAGQPSQASPAASISSLFPSPSSKRDAFLLGRRRIYIRRRCQYNITTRGRSTPRCPQNKSRAIPKCRPFASILFVPGKKRSAISVL